MAGLRDAVAELSSELLSVLQAENTQKSENTFSKINPHKGHL